jgi:hypothetical protein
MTNPTGNAEKKYIIIGANSRSKLAEMVEEALLDGWIPQCGAFIDYPISNQYCQTMIRNAEEIHDRKGN